MKGTENSGRKCVFFDRDGVVNVSPGPGYVERWEDFHLLPGFVDVLRDVLGRGYVSVVVTNQRGVSLGLMSAGTVEDIHRGLRSLLSSTHGLELLDILYCPHGKGECECRKPKPGMLLEAAARHGIDLAASWLVGDHERDVEAGLAAGCRTVLVSPEPAGTRADFGVRDMAELRVLLGREL
ncbi:D-glycero-alpha-D-manno-heptose-1,7-bisphosphate 7-phosphatase [Verrucomicrobiota bacterium]